MTSGYGPVTLSQLIWAIRQDLHSAQTSAAGDPFRFGVDKIEVDVTLEAMTSTDAAGGLNLKVLGVGADGKLQRSSANTSTAGVRVTISPRDARVQNGRLEVGAIDTEIP